LNCWILRNGGKVAKIVAMNEILSRRNSLIRGRRRRAMQTVKKLASVLRKKYGATKIVLIGSCANPERFGFQSDIDLAVENIPPDSFFCAAGEMLLTAGEFNVDLIPIEEANERMLQTVKNGEVVYEKR